MTYQIDKLINIWINISKCVLYYCKSGGGFYRK